jgi:glycosyltransferase involved in cell wall biosynthesis
MLKAEGGRLSIGSPKNMPLKRLSEASAQGRQLCFVGPMAGRRAGLVTSQSLILSDLFRRAGYDVTAVSESPNRYVRLGDIARTLARQRANIDVQVLDVYSGPSFVVADVASSLGKLFGQRVLMWLHGGALPEFMARYPKWARRVLSRAEAIVAPSNYLARAVEPYGFRARVIPNVIDLADYPYRRRETVRPRLFWMRSFHPVWNPEMAVRVLARVRETLPEATLVMAGQDKGLEAEVKRLAVELGLNGSVRFAGFLDSEAKAREGNAADIYINTNRIDNMPVAVVEACAMGLPVVATAVGGIRDLLSDGETGLLVPDDNDRAMAHAIVRLVKDPQLAAILSANGRMLAERSAWEQVRSQWEEMFVPACER